MAHPSPRRTFGRRKAPPRVTIARGGRVHTFTLRPWLVGCLAAVAFVGLLGVGLSGAYLIYRDDIMDAAIARQVELQYAYEDRIALLRSEIDRVTSRQAVKAETMEEKVAVLLERQEMLRTRQGLLDKLVDRAKDEGVDVGFDLPQDDVADDGVEPEEKTAASSAFDPLAYAPVPASAMDAVTRSVIRATPRKRPASPKAALEPATLRPAANADPMTLLNGVEGQIERGEALQATALAGLRGAAEGEADRIASVARRLDLPLGKTETEAVGGPFIPAGGFVDDVAATAETLSRLGALRRATAAWPIRSPVPGARRTSPFGFRTDPFLGRRALHSGLDLRAPYGTPVRATATGRVVHAGWRGGYGRMVEVDHGNGITTRYAHLSAISVKVGDPVRVGGVVGALGSSGRSTGPHLHYETRVRGRAVDPTRYLGALPSARS